MLSHVKWCQKYKMSFRTEQPRLTQSVKNKPQWKINVDITIISEIRPFVPLDTPTSVFLHAPTYFGYFLTFYLSLNYLFFSSALIPHYVGVGTCLLMYYLLDMSWNSFANILRAAACQTSTLCENAFFGGNYHLYHSVRVKKLTCIE